MSLLERVLSRLPSPVGRTPADVVHRENKWELLRYRPGPTGLQHQTPVLLVPSLINRHYVLDLLPGLSFTEALVGQGFDVYAVRWGTPEDEDRYLDFDTVTDRYLGRALARAARMSGVERLHLLGYCLGGTLTAIHAALRPERVATLTALAAPVDFSLGGTLATWTACRTFDVAALVEGMGLVPWPLMQASFHLLKPTLVMNKLVQLFERQADDEFLDQFLALETWGADNVSLPGAFYQRYIEELYRNNALARGTLAVSGRPVALAAIRCPTLVVSFEHDHIVPKESATALLSLVGASDKQHLHLSGGHVGAVTSRKGAARLWPSLFRFWAERDRQGEPLRRVQGG